VAHRASPIRLARLSQGLTLDVLAQRVGVHASVLSRAERGFVTLRPAIARRVRSVLGLSHGSRQ